MLYDFVYVVVIDYVYVGRVCDVIVECDFGMEDEFVVVVFLDCGIDFCLFGE